ncbi:type IV toxin-antitoxin system AbiEi family antitoxin [Cupriavidus sp. TMH.W2]|uniref:type IV toxin-antitoxin system AbiEi family antitoxin n=1 Tax=Cupriavidus sp. TMH.W2 TaxID=3434465 RepID=UPI003D76C413
MDKSAQNQTARARAAFEAEIANDLGIALSEATDGRISVVHVWPRPTSGPSLDLALGLDVAGKSVEVAVEALRFAYPRDIQGAVWKLSEYKLASERPQDLILLVAAESLSPGAREQLRNRGIGYFERNGNLRLSWRNWLINIERPDLPSKKKEGTSLFTDSREMVVHALLVNRNKWMTGSQLAEMSRTSSYTCSVVLQELERREWCESSGAGRTLRRRLTKPKQLLEAWATDWTKRKEKRTRWYAFTERPNLLLEHLTYQIEKASVSFDWAFTGAVAANIYAPLLTSVDTAEIIVPPGHAEGLAREIGLKPAEKGANVTIIERDGASLLFRESFPDYPSYFASPFIFYLDLLDGRGRNKELAQHVLEQLEI